MNSMETYYGHIRTQLDAILLFEACRLGLMPRIRRRLSERERLQIRSGSIYVWDEKEAGMRRWTDGKSWSASRVSGSFLTYREMEGTRKASPGIDENQSNENYKFSSNTKKRKSSFDHGSRTSPGSSPDELSNLSDSEDGFKYKQGGLFKQSFSITTSSNLRLHLISYYTREDVSSGKLVQPSLDPRFRDTRIPIEMYPDTSNSGKNLLPAITTVPLLETPPYQAMRQNSNPQLAPPQQYPLQQYPPPQGYYSYSPYPPAPQYPGYYDPSTMIPNHPNYSSNIPPQTYQQRSNPESIPAGPAHSFMPPVNKPGPAFQDPYYPSSTHQMPQMPQISQMPSRNQMPTSHQSSPVLKFSTPTPKSEQKSLNTWIKIEDTNPAPTAKSAPYKSPSESRIEPPNTYQPSDTSSRAPNLPTPPPSTPGSANSPSMSVLINNPPVIPSTSDSSDKSSDRAGYSEDRRAIGMLDRVFL